jgi:uroporphyrinogen decarboxylase
MDIAVLQREFGSRLTFCGTLCVQTTLAFGTEKDVCGETERRKMLFPDGGLFLGPTHAIQVGTPLENILALYRTAGSLAENIADDILTIQDGSSADKINMSKLF